LRDAARDALNYQITKNSIWARQGGGYHPELLIIFKLRTIILHKTEIVASIKEIKIS
jgi:hypothetical protein